ncbi:MAG TPA: hypothetical protein VH170_01160 [Chthoniobacterales bacterium]|jgi:hypothetical protein|nr:hypothetical protein [Chthoniobacterales bacterium]
MQGSHWVLERLLELEQDRREQEEDNRRGHALKMFLRALGETEIYYGTLRDSDKDRDREEELSRLWREASEELPVVDFELAKRCHAKSQYWADPVGWSEEAIERAHIAIHEMRDSLNRLLNREKARRKRKIDRTS